MASSLRVNAIVPASGTNVAIGTAGGTVTYAASVSGVSTFSQLNVSSQLNIGVGGTVITTSVGGNVGVGTDNPVLGKCEIHCPGTTNHLILKDTTNNWVSKVQVSTGGTFTIKSGDTEHLRINTSGVVSIPYQPAFRAVREGGGNPVITSAQRLPYDSTSASGGFDNTNSYNTSTFIYTAPVAGVYFFQASTYTELNTESMWDIRVNGNIRQRAELRQTAGDDIGDNTIINASCILSLSANDQVDVYWSANSVQLITGSGLISFSGCKIS